MGLGMSINCQYCTFREENGVANEVSSSVTGSSNCPVRIQSCEKQWASALLSVNADVLSENHHERVAQF